jgi:S-disulfanyl-L-cysteine oxidoreductase SoxD
MSRCRNSILILRSPREALMLRSAAASRASRSTRAGHASLRPSFETRPSGAPQDEDLCWWRSSVALLTTLALLFVADPSSAAERKLNIGQPATPDVIAGWDIDVRPDGQGLPPGKGSVKAGEQVYIEKCAACHGEFGESAGRWPQVAGGTGSLKSDDPVKTVGSYFAHLSTVFDYVRHAMPFGDAQSLTNDELYAVVAYMLFLNDIVDDKFVLSQENFTSVKMPNAGGFYDDDRETAEKAFWARPCMANCKGDVKITGRARVIDVTPDDKAARRGAD